MVLLPMEYSLVVVDVFEGSKHSSKTIAVIPYKFLSFDITSVTKSLHRAGRGTYRACTHHMEYEEIL